jgi:hypothetical protein
LHTLRVIHRVHTQLELRLVRVPALWAHLQVIDFRLDDFFFEIKKLESKSAPVALGNRILA